MGEINKMGNHWYTDGEVSVMAQECPSGFRPGRSLPEDFGKKISAIKLEMTEEQRSIRYDKWKNTMASKSPEEIAHIRSAMSDGARNWFLNATEQQLRQRSGKISKANKGKFVSEETRRKMSESQLGVPKPTSKNVKSLFKKGHTPWNKDKVGVQERSRETVERCNNTKRLRGTFNTSKPEERMYIDLCEQYGKDNVIRQYHDERYPFNCDFYIKSEDLFIELNAHWTHGGRPYDENDTACQEQLAKWQEKAKTSRFYKTAIDVWTHRDVNKSKVAKENNLNIRVIYK